MQPSKHKMTVFVQIRKLISRKLARKYGLGKQSREFDPWSHVAPLVYAQFSYAISRTT